MLSRLQFRFLFVLAALFAVLPLTAQVRGISYTLSPVAHYTFWDNEAGLKDGLLAGGRLGIGFGELIELRGKYLFDLGLKTDFTDFGLTQSVDGLTERDVKLTRYGGEIKLNLSRGKFLPFLTLGTGIQQLELDGGLSNEHIYASGGLGIIISVADRFNFTLEGKNTAYNFNSVRNLLTEADRNLIGVNEDDFGSERLTNWSLGAGFSIYLGGRRPGQLSAVDEAYERAFQGGFRGASILVEPSISHINFNEELSYRDTWLGGAAVGLNFGPLVGFRAYYLQAMDDNKLNLDFDKLSLFGGDFRFRLSNRQTGFAPFLILGGGYINASDDYIGREDTSDPISQAFAAGGGGIALNLGRTLRLTGSYKALLTTGREVEDLSSTDQVRTSGQWSVGVNLTFGKKVDRPDAIFAEDANEMMRRQRAQDALEAQVALNEQARRNAEVTADLRAGYENRLSDLRMELLAATESQDSMAIDSLERTLAQTQETVSELQQRETDIQTQLSEAGADSVRLAAETQRAGVNTAAPSTYPGQTAPPGYNTQRNAAPAQSMMVDPSQSRIVLSPAEFEGLIEEIFEGLNAGMSGGGYPSSGQFEEEIVIESDGSTRTMRSAPATTNGATAMADTARLNALERKLDVLESTVRVLAERQSDNEEADAEERAALRQEMQESTERILEEIRMMREQMVPRPDPTRRELRQQRRDSTRQGGNG